MRTQETEEMRTQPLFAAASATTVEAILAASFLQRFPARVDLVREGEPADFLHLVVDGQVEIFAGWNGRETTISIVGAGTSFIVAAVLLDRVYLKSARSLTPSRILLMPAEIIRRCFVLDAGLAQALARELALAYRGLVKELKSQKLRSGLERLANWLIAHDDVTGRRGSFDLPFDKKVLASRLGMAPEVLSRALASLESYEVTVKGPRIELHDREALRRLARPDATIDDPLA